MGQIDVTGWPPTKVIAAVEAIQAKHHGAPVRLTWQPTRSHDTERPETPADAARRLQLVRDRLKG